MSDEDLLAAVAEIEKGLVDADLGGGVIKKRIAREGRGKSGGFRTIVLLKAGERAFFAYIFAKNDKDNIKPDELNAFKRLAAELLAHDDEALKKDVESGALTEVFPANKAEIDGANKGTE